MSWFPFSCGLTLRLLLTCHSIQVNPEAVEKCTNEIVRLAKETNQTATSRFSLAVSSVILYTHIRVQLYHSLSSVLGWAFRLKGSKMYLLLFPFV